MLTDYEYLFRVDGSHQIGLGHIYRTKALASSLKSLGKNLVFLIKKDKESERILNNFDFIVLKNEINFKDELNTIKKLVEEFSVKTIISDLFIYNDNYLESLSRLDKNLVTFHEHTDHDSLSNLIINYNTYKEVIKNENKNEQHCLGPRYCIFPETLINRKAITVHSDVKKVLLSFGGSDPCDYTFKIAKLLDNNHHCLESIEEVIVHLGPSNSQHENIKKLLHESSLNLTIKKNVKDLHAIMCQCDLAFASGGNTMYELCSLGIPTIVLPQNQHQEAFAKELSRKKVILLIEKSEINNDIRILKSLINLIENQQVRVEMHKFSTKFFDFKGVKRVANSILNL